MKLFPLPHLPLTDVRFHDVVARSNELVARPDRSLIVELWEATEGTFEHELPGEEVLYCLEGEEHVEDLSTGEVLLVSAGDLLHYPMGSRVRVTYTGHFRALIMQVAPTGVEPLEPA
ncbi:cupin domain-containing protein [Nocardioides limicola]|uniref:cupin domain-containing protein n=1 Tax=Nocardioides limicola TaxID=2803368 RepID=UPI00193BAE25|nr:cupin domain-containing protein [Nocardioides sp. DJM-14]